MTSGTNNQSLWQEAGVPVVSPRGGGRSCLGGNPGGSVSIPILDDGDPRRGGVLQDEPGNGEIQDGIMDAKIARNKELWDSRVAGHLKSDFYDLEGFRAGRCSLEALDVELMGPVDGLSLLHLQCHFGQDTLSWARRGARVTGVDLSERAIDAARDLAEELALPARFEVCNVLEYQPDYSYDRVYTSYGVLGWLPELKTWAKVVASALKAGGRLVLVEFHPALLMYDFPTGQLAFEYFHQSSSEMVKGSYADSEDTTEREEHFWSHSLADVITCLLDAGLELRTFRETDWSPHKCFEGMIEREPERYVYGKCPVRWPHIFALVMEKR